nr:MULTISPECIES: 7-carboxy-7-deazaguanine synthase [unclassified Oleiphilus]
MSYKVKEMFYSLQGEGARAGRASVFCRFSKCNLWNGREDSRADAVCNFCDTEILGTDGQNGGVFETALDLGKAIAQLWPHGKEGSPYVVFTGGEPMLQLDEALVEQMHQLDFEVAVETNGTLRAPNGIDWICISPKADSKLVLERADELKLVYPQEAAMPERFSNFDCAHFFLSPKASPIPPEQGVDGVKRMNTQRALDYCLANPKWRLTLQLHKILEID